MTSSNEISEPPFATAVHTLQTLIGEARPSSNMTGLANLVLAQLVNAMGSETPEAVASNLEFGNGALSGTVVIFCDRLLFVADIRDAPTEKHDDAVPATWSASVTLFPRSALRSIEVVAKDALARRGVDSNRLAHETNVLLHYEGIEDPIILTPSNTGDLGSVLALVRADLEGGLTLAR